MLKGQTRNYKEKLLYEGLLLQAAENPGKIAVFSQDREVTYGALLKSSLGICRALQNRGVRPGDRVVVNLKRNIEQVETIIGVLLAGGVYVPVGTHQPEHRLKSIAEQSGARLVISEPVEPAEGMAEDIKKVSPDSEAYIIFTSGSTGKPKGVRLSHKAAMNTIDCVNEYFSVTGNDRVLAVSQIDFDLSVYDMFGMLAVGGSIVLLTNDTAQEPTAWKERIISCGVTLWNSVPALFDMLLTSFEGRETFPTLKKVFLSGDWVSLDIYERMKKISSNMVLVTMGGATEASIWSNYHIVEGISKDWTSVPYGVPLADQRFAIMDENGCEVADGTVGELWIGGKGVAIGYTDKEITMESFIEYAGERFYRTGDYGRLKENGEMEFCGRRDQQVKLNGFRVEMGEIERVLAGFEGIAKTAAVVTEDKHIVGGVVPVLGNGKYISNREYPLTADDSDESAQVRQIIAKVLENADVSLKYRELTDFYRDFSENGRKAQPINGYMKYLDGKSGLLSDILSGRAEAHRILEDDTLSPESGAFSDPDTQAVLEKLVQQMRSDCDGIEVKMALVGTQRGLFAEYILENFIDISLDVIVSGGTFEQQTVQRLSRFKNAQVIRINRLPDYSRIYAIYDVVLSIYGLHTYVDEAMAGRISAFLLKEGGKLYVVEQEMLRPEAYLTSMLIEKGFSGLNMRRKRTRNPMLPAEEWIGILKSCGLSGGEVMRRSNAYLLALTNDNTPVFSEKLAEYVEKRLPYYMIPQKIYVLPDWEYSANGKVKKDFCISADTEKSSGDKFEGMAAQVADMFRQVLKKEQVWAGRSFFEMGGDSLLLTRLLTIIKDRFQMDYSMKDAYDKPYIGEFAERIEQFMLNGGCAIEEGEI